MKIGVSACLVGMNTKYDGKNNYNKAVVEYLKDKEYITICPEVTGGLPTPRVPSEQIGEKVINKDGIDVTVQFYEGALKSLTYLQSQNVTTLILKAKSPSCGYKQIYNGTFTKTLVDGHGVFTKLAIKNGFTIFTETDIENMQKK